MKCDQVALVTVAMMCLIGGVVDILSQYRVTWTGCSLVFVACVFLCISLQCYDLPPDVPTPIIQGIDGDETSSEVDIVVV